MHFYRAYNLIIGSELALPELMPIAASASAEVIIRYGQLTLPNLSATQTQCRVSLAKAQAFLHWPSVGTFLVQNGTEIVLDLLPNVEESVVRLFLLGAGLGMLLYQRGLFVLHASAISVDGVVIAFMGDKGWGKSTTAGILHKRGYKLFSDDVTAIDLSNPYQPMVLPGYSQIKLWPESATALGNNPETLSRLHPQLEKRDFQPQDALASAAQPLKQIYLLGMGEELAIEPLSSQQALIALMQNWYCARFGVQIFQITNKTQHFVVCTNLIKKIPIFHLRRQLALEALDDIATLLESHVMGKQDVGLAASF